MNDKISGYEKPIAKKLNRYFFWRVLSVIIQINIIIFIIIFSSMIFKSESVLKDKYESGEYEDEDFPVKGIKLPEFLQDVMPMNQRDVYRTLVYDASASGYSALHHLVYKICITKDDHTIVLSYSFNHDAHYISPIVFLLLLFELFVFIQAVSINKRYVRKVLRPIRDIVNTARDITLSDGPNQLAGQISSIQANELTRRLPIDDKPDELKPLALEINALLTRINDAYDAQIRFVSDAAHELRTPISVIQGYANLLDRWGKTDEKTMQESIDAIKSESQSMKYLIEQLHFLAQGENDTLRLNITEFDVCELVAETVGDMRIIDKEHIYETKLCGETIIAADRELFQQALRILLENSKKYSERGTVINVCVREEDDVVITVEDNGIGIPPEAIPHIFERFYRSDQSRTRKTGGSGLGLAIAKLIMDRHSFIISALSREGIGTRITLTVKKRFV